MNVRRIVGGREVLTDVEVALLIARSLSTLRNGRTAAGEHRRVPPSEKIDGRVYYERAALEEWCREQGIGRREP